MEARARESVVDLIEAIARRAVLEGESPSDVTGRQSRVGAVVREFGPLLPQHPTTETRDRIDQHLMVIAESLDAPGAFDRQRGWLYGYLDGRSGSVSSGVSPGGMSDAAQWQNGYAQGIAQGKSDAVDYDRTIEKTTLRLKHRLAVTRWVMLAVTILTGLTWLTAMRSFADALLILAGAGSAVLILFLFRQAASATTFWPRFLGRTAATFWLPLTVVVAWAVVDWWGQAEPPHGPIGGAAPTILWALTVVVTEIMSRRIQYRIDFPHGRPLLGVRGASTVARANDATSDQGDIDERALIDPGTIGLLGLWVYAFAGFAQPFRWSRRTSRLEFWLFIGVGLPTVALLLVFLMGQLTTTFTEPVAQLLVALPIALVWLWWVLALIGATARRLLDIQRARAVALAWLLIPVIWLLMFIVYIAVGMSMASISAEERIGPRELGEVLVVVAAVVSVLAVLSILSVGVIPTRGAPASAVHPRVVWRAITIDLADVADVAAQFWSDFVGVVKSVWRLDSEDRKEKILFNSFFALIVAILVPIPSLLRAVILVIIGLTFSAAHIARWVMQERNSRAAHYQARYADGRLKAWKNPHWSPMLVRPHKALSLVWIWMCVIAAGSEDYPALTVSVWMIVLVGFCIYLVLPVFLLVLTPALLPVLLYLWSSVGSAEGESSSAVVQSVFALALPVFFIWGCIALLWAVRILFRGPKDRRTIQYRAFKEKEYSAAWF